MGRISEKAREALMDSAEELFARDGIDAVSNRRIAEHAGTANHSAVAYHFGNRDELIRALVSRHMASVERRRVEMLAALGPDPDLHDLVACRILPWVEELDTLPTPSWRARFLFQARSIPSVAAVFSSGLESSADFDDLARRMLRFSVDVSGKLMQARIGLLSGLVPGVCAQYEARREQHEDEGSWLEVGYFLIDSAVGLLTAPVTHPTRYYMQPPTPPLV